MRRKKLIFINLGKFRKKPEKESTGDTVNMIEEFKKRGINVLNWYWTLGRYDTVFIFEAVSEKEALKLATSIFRLGYHRNPHRYTEARGSKSSMKY